MDDGPLNTATLYGLPFAVSPKKALQCSFKQSLLQWSHLERSEAESKGPEGSSSRDLPEWSENAGFSLKLLLRCAQGAKRFFGRLAAPSE